MSSLVDGPEPAVTVGTDDFASVPLRRIPTQSRSRDKVSRALSAADEIAAREGVEALTLNRVAEAAGLTVGALHQYLPDREAIATALVARYHERIESLLDEIIGRIRIEQIDDPVAEVIGHISRIYSEERAARVVRSASAAPGSGREHKLRMAAKVQQLMIACGVEHCDVVVARTVFTAADAIMHEAFAGDGAHDDALLGELETMLRAYLERSTRT